MINKNNQRIIIEIDKSVSDVEATQAVMRVMCEGKISHVFHNDIDIPIYCYHTHFTDTGIHVETRDKRTLKSADSFYVYKESK